MSCPRLLVYYARAAHCGTEAAAIPGVFHRLPLRPGFQTRRHLTDRVNQRYGTANEPPPSLGTTAIVTPPPSQVSEKDTPSSSKSKGARGSAKSKDNSETSPTSAKQDPHNEAASVKGSASGDVPSALEQDSVLEKVSVQRSGPTESQAAASKSTSANMKGTDPASALSALELPPGTPAQQEKPPHLEAPPYVHHFDTYTLVQSLQDNKAFTESQSVTVMKAVRGLLADNMELAREGLVSRGDAEMDTYQFRAGAGELRTEIRKRRATAEERMRADRLQLQHEVDTLGQRITQESLTLKDELKGMFDDRKMAVQLERRNVDNRIQELGYKITVAMNSGMRNEIEGLRFILTRRTVLALAGVVLMSLAMLRLASHQREVAKRKDTANTDSSGGGSGAARDAGLALVADRIPPDMDARGGDLSRRVQNGENPALVSLG